MNWQVHLSGLNRDGIYELWQSHGHLTGAIKPCLAPTAIRDQLVIIYSFPVQLTKRWHSSLQQMWSTGIQNHFRSLSLLLLTVVWCFSSKKQWWDTGQRGRKSTPRAIPRTRHTPDPSTRLRARARAVDHSQLSPSSVQREQRVPSIWSPGDSPVPWLLLWRDPTVGWRGRRMTPALCWWRGAMRAGPWDSFQKPIKRQARF